MFLVDVGFGWCFGAVEGCRGLGEWVLVGESVFLRRGASLPLQPLPGPFSNGPYGVEDSVCIIHIWIAGRSYGGLKGMVGC